VVLILLFFRHRKDVQKQLATIVRGRSKINQQQRSVNLSKANSFSKISSRSNALIRIQNEVGRILVYFLFKTNKVVKASKQFAYLKSNKFGSKNNIIGGWNKEIPK